MSLHACPFSDAVQHYAYTKNHTLSAHAAHVCVSLSCDWGFLNFSVVATAGAACRGAGGPARLSASCPSIFLWCPTCHVWLSIIEQAAPPSPNSLSPGKYGAQAFAPQAAATQQNTQSCEISKHGLQQEQHQAQQVHFFIASHPSAIWCHVTTMLFQQHRMVVLVFALKQAFCNCTAVDGVAYHFVAADIVTALLCHGEASSR